MKLIELFNQGKFVLSSEVGPPKGIEIEKVLDDAELLRGKIDAFNVTDLQSSVMRLGALPTCHLLKERGLEPIFQVTCRDRNRLALQSDILSAAVLGVENLLILTGDHPILGDHPEAKPVFDLDSVHLLSVAKGLTEKKDMEGNELEGKAPEFCMGAVVNPGADPLEPQIIKMEKKVNAGAQFFQTQAVYEVDKFARFMEKVKYLEIPIMAGIVFLKSARMAQYMNENVAGVHVPDKIINEMAGVEKDNRANKSIEIAVRLIKELKSLCNGVHIMSLGWEHYIPAVLEKAGINSKGGE